MKLRILETEFEAFDCRGFILMSKSAFMLRDMGDLSKSRICYATSGFQFSSIFLEPLGHQDIMSRFNLFLG